MSVVSDIHRLVDRSVRFAAWDPLLTGARTAGLVRWGPTLSALVHASALRWPSRPAVIDDDGTLTYRQLDQQADRLAAGLRELPDGAIGLLCRNHRGFPLAQLAIERSGRNAVMLNTSLPASQLAQIAQREELAVVIADDEFADRLTGDLGAGCFCRRPRCTQSCDLGGRGPDAVLGSSCSRREQLARPKALARRNSGRRSATPACWMRCRFE